MTGQNTNQAKSIIHNSLRVWRPFSEPKGSKNRWSGSETLFIILFLLAFLERTVFDLGPNFELLTSAVILSSYFLNRRSTLWLTFLVLALSDRLIGNSKIFLFTWTGFLLPALFSPVIINKLSNQITKLTKKKFAHFILLPAAGISANFFFFTWTNFGVWLLDSWGMYTKDLSGLILCYVNGLPFLKNQIVSSLIFIPSGLLTIEFIRLFFKKYIYKQKPSVQGMSV